MQVETITVGALQTNCYLITKNNKTIIIDPGDEFEKIKKHCENKRIVGILVTHHHFDHVGALKQLEEYFHLQHNPLSIDGFNYTVILNPGHTKDSLSYYFKDEKILFSGDFIFFHNIGRCDLEGGNFREMQESIKMILTYPKDIKIYPGHGSSTTLKEEIFFLQRYI